MLCGGVFEHKWGPWTYEPRKGGYYRACELCGEIEHR
ncbi:hypothetical protein STBA_10650 [Streptomyces sp. MP131-18]|nr:hypothetical protein STBA_10650 [Streptomyces sp. MP131-18]